MYLPLFIQYNTFSAGLPFWTASRDMISEPPRTKYSGEPEMSRFLVRAKAYHEKGLFGNFGRSGRISGPGQKNGRATYFYVQSHVHFCAQNHFCIPAYLEIKVVWRLAYPSQKNNL